MCGYPGYTPYSLKERNRINLFCIFSNINLYLSSFGLHNNIVQTKIPHLPLDCYLFTWSEFPFHLFHESVKVEWVNNSVPSSHPLWPCSKLRFGLSLSKPTLRVGPFRLWFSEANGLNEILYVIRLGRVIMGNYRDNCFGCVDVKLKNLDIASNLWVWIIINT